jgi:hypothetical protein
MSRLASRPVAELRHEVRTHLEGALGSRLVWTAGSPALLMGPRIRVLLLCATDGGRSRFEFAVHASHVRFLEGVDRPRDAAYLALACGSSGEVFLIPYRDFTRWIAHPTEMLERGMPPLVVHRLDDGFVLGLPSHLGRARLESYRVPPATAGHPHARSHMTLGPSVRHR